MDTTADSTPKVGETWSFDASNPWEPGNRIRAIVMDLRDGWVKYRFDHEHPECSGNVETTKAFTNTYSRDA